MPGPTMPPGQPTPATTNAPPVTPGAAPTTTYAVGVRQLSLSRGADRPLPTTIWYPARSKQRGAAPAIGRFPLVLFSHGLTGAPAAYEGLLTRLASAGFVVAAPAYPHTSAGASSFSLVDVLNQPADAWHVIGAILQLDSKSGDPLAGHIEARVGIAGHSAGGYTTAGMLSAPAGGGSSGASAPGAKTPNANVAGAVIISGGSMGAVVESGPPALFIHGDQDPTVTYSTGRHAFASVPGPKAFLTVLGGGHWEFLAPGARGFDPTVQTMTDFLRWTLYGDPTARARVGGGATGVARVEVALG